MTTIAPAAVRPAEPAETPRSGWGRWAWAPAVFVAVVAVRAFGNARGYDVFVDEVTYLRVSEGVARDLSVELYGKVFFLHPPALFFLEGGWLQLFGSASPDVIDGVMQARWLIFLLAGLTAVVAVRLAWVLAGRWAAVATFVLVLLDPFLIRINSRNLLETPTLLFVLSGMLVLAGPLAHGGRLTNRRAAAGGVLLGLGVLTKDTAAITVSLPLLYLFVRRETRGAALSAGVAMVLTYLPYPVATALTGHWQAFVDEYRRVHEALLAEHNDFRTSVGVAPCPPDEFNTHSPWLNMYLFPEVADYDRAQLTWLWDVTTVADKTIIERNQAGVDSRFYVPGPLSSMEDFTRRFLEWYVAIMRDTWPPRAERAGTGQGFASLRALPAQ